MEPTPTRKLQAAWESLTPEMYGLFWTLTVHDIYVPTKTYEREIDKVGLSAELTARRA